MGNGIFNPKAGGYTDTEQNTKDPRSRGAIGDRSNNLVSLIGAERVSRRSFKYEGTYYITEDGEIYDWETSKVLQQNSYQSGNDRTIQRICKRSKILAIN